MKNSKAAPKTVLETILEWSTNRPIWQRDTLRRIISTGSLREDDVDELVALCKKENGDVDVQIEARPLEEKHLPSNPGASDSITLLSVADTKGVNCLAPNQTLTFGANGITVIYGDNGTGKSGYARILKRACRARSSDRIQENIYAEDEPSQPPSAIITYKIGSTDQPPESWQDNDESHDTLSAVSVFDSSCASVHIKKKNEVAYRPFGLDVPDELAGACLAVKDALERERAQLLGSQDQVFANPTWNKNTKVGKLLGSLKTNSDPQSIEILAKLSDEERDRLEQLKGDLSKDVLKVAAEQNRKADSVDGLLSALDFIATETADKALTEVYSRAADADSKRTAAELAAADAFSVEPLDGTGGEVWRILWESARRYATKIAYPDQPFPPLRDHDTRCVLCQQPLGVEALDRMSRFEEFIRKDTDRQAKQAVEAYEQACNRLSSLRINLLQVRANYEELRLLRSDLARQTLRYLASARLRRLVLQRAIQDRKALELPPPTANPSDELIELKAALRERAFELKKAAEAEELKKLEGELAELADRQRLACMLPGVEAEINRLQAIAFLDRCLAETTTNAITNLGNHIADTVVTPKLRDRFHEEIVKLAAEKVRVEIDRAGGRYGAPQYRVRMFAKPDAQVSEILSEGEQTCVALAAFLAELATATHQSTLVFDDPVSSLDHRWRKQVAKRLIEEAEQRQVIVFTHDIIFVNDLDDLAGENKCPFSAITVTKGPIGAGIINYGLPWIAGRIEDRIDKLEKAAREAVILCDADDEEAYRVEVGHIYNDLRASWERALETIAFVRVVQRHRDYINPNDLKKVSVLTESDCEDFLVGFKHCCEIVDAHDPSAGRNAAPPPATTMMNDIKQLKDWVGSLRERHKKVA